MKIYTPILLSALIDNKKMFKEEQYLRFLTNEGIFRIKNNQIYKYEIDDDTDIYSEYCLMDNSIKNINKKYNIPYPNILERVQELHYKINEYELIVEYVNDILSDYYFINILEIEKLNVFLMRYS